MTTSALPEADRIALVAIYRERAASGSEWDAPCVEEMRAMKALGLDLTAANLYEMRDALKPKPRRGRNATATCSGCNVPLDVYTIGCRTCQARRRWRAKKEQES